MKYVINVTVTMTRQIIVNADTSDIAEDEAKMRALTEPLFFPGEYPDDTIVTEVEEISDEIL